MASRTRASFRGGQSVDRPASTDASAVETSPNSAQNRQGNAALATSVPATSTAQDTGTTGEWGAAMGATLAADVGGGSSAADAGASETDSAVAGEAVASDEAWSGRPPWDQVANPMAVFGSKGSRTEAQKASFGALVDQLSTAGDSSSKMRARQQINKWLDGSVTTAELAASAVGGINGTKGMGIEAQRRADAFEPGQGDDFFSFLVSCWANYQAVRNAALGGLETGLRNGGRHGGLGVNYLLDQKYLDCVRERAAAEGIALHVKGEDGFYSLNIGQFSEIPLGEYLRVIEYDTSFGKLLSIVGTIASFFPGVGTAIGAFVHGVAAVASGGTLLDGLKAGLGAYLSAGGFGGGAAERLAGSVLQSDGDPLAVGVALLNVGLEGTALQEALHANHIQITSEGLSITPGGGSLGIQLNLDGDVQLSFAVSANLSVTLEDDGGLGIELSHGDTTLEATTDGTITVRQDVGDMAGDGTRSSIGVSGNLIEGGMSLIAGQTSLANPDGFATHTEGSIDLQTGDSQLDVSHNATLTDARDQIEQYAAVDDRSADYTPLFPGIAVPDSEVADSSIDGNIPVPAMDAGPDIGFETPETAILHWPDPNTPLEEVSVVAQWINPLAQVVDTPTHTAPAQGDGSRESDAPATPGVHAAHEVLAYGSALAAAFASLGDDEMALGVASSIAALNLVLREATADPSLENIARVTKAVVDVYAEAAEELSRPSAHSARAVSRSFGLALDLRTLFDPAKPLEARVDALMSAVTTFHPGARAAVEVYQNARDLTKFAYALANADIARDPSTGRTTFDSLFASADSLKAYVQGAGDWIAESAIEVGELAEDVIEEELGADAASGIADGFARAGVIGEAAADSLADAGAGLAVIYGALPATIIGAVRGAGNALDIATDDGP